MLSDTVEFYISLLIAGEKSWMKKDGNGMFDVTCAVSMAPKNANWWEHLRRQK